MDCEPAAVSGPRPCDSDDMCVENHGEGRYCDGENTDSDGCGGTINWPVCTPD